MAFIRHVKIQNFRGINRLDWHLNGRIICLIGPGDSGKTTLLNAIELALLPRWSTPFTDSDFYNANTEEELIIEVTVGELPSGLEKQEKYGLYLRGYSIIDQEFHDDPSDEDEEVLTVRLLVDSSLEPSWTVIKSSNPEPKPISFRDRELMGVASLGENVDRNLTWSRGSALARITDSQSSGHVIAVANRKAREAVSGMDLDEWQKIADKAKEKTRNYGLPVNELRPGLDVNAIRFGQSVLSLYNGAVPLQSLGLGSKRLSALAVQEAGIGASSIMLIDEVEYGLEPHRIRKLLKILCEGRKEGQVLMTSHSPTTVVDRSVEDLRFTSLRAGNLNVLRFDQSSLDALQAAVRRCPMAVFARTIIVCEGKTEEALCRALNRAWAKNCKDEEFELSGIVAVTGGGDAAPETARQFGKLGYKTIFLGDSDKKLTPSENEMRKSGVWVVRWQGEMSTEQRICEDLPFEAIKSILNLAFEIRGEESCRERCKTEFEKLGVDASLITSADTDCWQKSGIEESIIRKAIGRAAKSGEWFKDLNTGEKLADLVIAQKPMETVTPFGCKLKELRQYLYGR